MTWIPCAGGRGNRSKVSSTSSAGQRPQQSSAAQGTHGPDVTSLMPWHLRAFLEFRYNQEKEEGGQNANLTVFKF